jgi:hypothetical protein
MSISEDAKLQTDRDAIIGRSNPGGNLPPSNPAATPPSPRRFVFTGTPGPLARFAPDPPTTLTVNYQKDQASLSSYVTDAVRALWDQHIDPDNFSASWKDVGAVIKVLIAESYMGSAEDAADYYRNIKVVNNLSLPRMHASPLDVRHLSRMAGSVAQGTFYHHLNTKGEDPASASEKARNTMSGAGARFALNGARNTILNAVARDPDATGWDRMLEPMGACSYCAMQAAKGPFKPGKMGFRAHDYCKCLPVPILRGRSPSAGIADNTELQDQWNKITETATGQDARAAWEEYWRGHGSGQSSAA